MSRPPVFLYYEDYNNQPMGHINLILKLTFFNHFYYCPFCNKRVLHNQALHYCHNVCKACRFYKRTEDNYFEMFATRAFCDRRDSSKFSYKQCPDCGVVCYSDTCFQSHMAGSSCKRGFLCHKCHAYEVKKDHSSYEDFLASHKCDILTCRLCSEKYADGTTHMCRMKPLQKQSYYPNLAFFDTETTLKETSIEACKKCMLREYKYVFDHNLMHASRKEVDLCAEKEGVSLRCSFHRSCDGQSRNFHSVNALSFYYEDQKRGNFSRIAFYDPRLNMPDDCCEEKNVLKNEYFLPTMKGETLTTKKVRVKGQFPRVNVKPLSNKLDRSQGPLAKFLFFIINERFRNYTIMSFNGQSFDMILLLKEAYELGLTPEIITRGQKVMCLSFREFNIRFFGFHAL